MQLTANEQAEYERQRQELASQFFHDPGKCGKPLLTAHIFKRHTRLDRQYCEVHHVIVNMSGWQIGYDIRGKLTDL